MEVNLFNSLAKLTALLACKFAKKETAAGPYFFAIEMQKQNMLEYIMPSMLEI